MVDDPYSVLEVSRGATEVEIKAAYRRLAATYHPDRNPGFREAATEKLKELNAAYEAIKASDRAPSPEATDSANGESAKAGDREEGRRGRPDSRAKIAAGLVQAGLLVDSDDEDPAVDALHALIPDGAGIELCIACGSFSLSGEYGFREMHRSAMRIAGADSFSPIPSISASAGPVTRGEAILCTVDSLFWVVRRVAAASPPPWEEVSATAFALGFDDVLGSRVANRRKGEVQIWIDEGPTLTCRLQRSDAERLATYIDAAAASR